MLTRLEVDGFKNLVDFSVDLGPFTCIAGENGVGKSNLFDAIEFLGLLADHSLVDAAQRVRGVDQELGEDPVNLFAGSGRNQRREMTIAAEMLVPPIVVDEFDREERPTSTYLRYEVQLALVPAEGREKMSRLVLQSESLTPITQAEARQRLVKPLRTPSFRNHAVINRRKSGPYIRTSHSGETLAISLHQDGGSRGQPRLASAGRAQQTVLSTISSAEWPTAMAARREMQSWRRLALEPSAMRTPDRYRGPRTMSSTGAHLTAALHRLSTEESSGDVLARVTTLLDRLGGLQVDRIRIDEDDARQQFSLALVERGGLVVPARNLSEGTLRFLAVCVLLEDPSVEGLICLEEPENGIHPANVPAMVELVQRLALDAQEPLGADNPLRQVLINTHSPFVVQTVGANSLLFATRIRDRQQPGRHRFSLVPMSGSWRDDADAERVMTKADVLPYLAGAPDAQLSLTTRSA
ncbi:MAG: AAA family ATPase [Kineosporiaceae bacterium]